MCGASALGYDLSVNVACFGLNLDFDAANFDETQPLERSMTWPGPPAGSAPAASNSSGSVRAAKADAGWYPGAAPRPADAPASRPGSWRGLPPDPKGVPRV